MPKRKSLRAVPTTASASASGSAKTSAAADDESIDDSGSEVGWDSEDEVAFGKHRSTGGDNGGDGDDESDSFGDVSDQEEAGDGEILLSDIIGLQKATTGGSSSFHSKRKETSSTAKISEKSTAEDEEVDDIVDAQEQDDGDATESEILNDGGEESGEGSSSGGSSEDDVTEDEEEEENEEEDDEDEELEQVHSRLMKAIDHFATSSSPSSAASIGSKNRPKNNKLASTSDQSAPESTFSSVFDGGDVSMNALLGALEDNVGLNVVKKRLDDLESGIAAPKYVEKVVAERVERKQVYEKTKSEMDKWNDTVKINRHVSTLDLAQDKRQQPSFKSLVTKFVPTTAMEREIQMVLVKAGASSDKQIEEREAEALSKAENLSKEEIRVRQAELAKVKALMFYEQMKRHRLNKIKSKAYRNIKRKQRLKKQRTEEDAVIAGIGAEGDPEAAAEEMEKRAYQRVKERMDMRHKNTSKWAKMALTHGHADQNLREAYHESVQLGHELTNKMNEDVGVSHSKHSLSFRAADVGEGADGGSSSSSSDDSDDSDSGKGSRHHAASKRRKGAGLTAGAVDAGMVSSKLANKLRAALPTAGGDLEAADGSKTMIDGKFKKLFEMDFMKRAATQQRERAREEAKSVLREIVQMERDERILNNEEMEEEEEGQRGQLGNDDLHRAERDEESREERARRRQAAKDIDKLFSPASGTGMVLSRRSTRAGGSTTAGAAKSAVSSFSASILHETHETKDNNSAADGGRSGAVVLRVKNHQGKRGRVPSLDNDSGIDDDNQEEEDDEGGDGMRGEELETGESNPWLVSSASSHDIRNGRGKGKKSSGFVDRAAAKDKTADSGVIYLSLDKAIEKNAASVHPSVSTSSSAFSSTSTPSGVAGSSSSSKRSRRNNKQNKGETCSNTGTNVITSAAGGCGDGNGSSGGAMAAVSKAAVGNGKSGGKRKRVEGAQEDGEVGASKEETLVKKGKGKLPERAPLLHQKSQAQIVRMAFAGPDLEEEFRAYKAREIDLELGVNDKKMKVISDVKAGWGDWAGPGNTMISDKIQRKRDRLLTHIQRENEERKALRADSSSGAGSGNKRKAHVLISERTVKPAAKFTLARVPHPFTTREEYERSLQMPLGEEWNASQVVRNNTQPEVKVRAGRVIEPIKLDNNNKKKKPNTTPNPMLPSSSKEKKNKNAPGGKKFSR